ncbi:hypothetical protein T06_7750 [Trichinella sp. T6]|nr:hypothetical protein T06_7750 [Trichinella sp. T6]
MFAFLCFVEESLSIRSMLDLTNYIQILHNLSCVHLSVNSSDALPTRD